MVNLTGYKIGSHQHMPGPARCHPLSRTYVHPPTPATGLGRLRHPCEREPEVVQAE